MPNIDFDIFLNIIKRPESVIYKTRVGPQSANIAYVGSDILSSDNNLSISDTSSFVASNRQKEEDIVNYIQSSSFVSSTDDFLLTDIYSTFNISSGSQVKTPLFYRHTFKNFPENATVDTESIRLYDDLLEELEDVKFYLDAVNGKLYSNLESFYTSTDYKFYYVQYAILENDTKTIYTELLDNEEIFREAQLEDFDLNTMQLNPDAKVWLKEDLGTSFQLSLPIATDFSFKPKGRGRLRVLPPVSKSSYDPWHVRVTNGKVYHTNGKLYKISDSQYLSQNFMPVIGTKRSQKENPTLINTRVIKTDYNSIHESSALELFIDITIKNAAGVLRADFTTNPNSSGTVWDSVNKIGIKSVDHKTGFIELDGIELQPTDSIECTYYYIEDKYEYTDVDLNPVQNERMLTQRVLIYIDPDSQGGGLHSKYFNKDGSAVPGSSDDYSSWIDSETLYGSGNKFVLAEITVGNAKGVKDSITLDTRITGGKIKETHIEKAEQFPEYDSIWDVGMWDGKPYPGNLCFYVEVPITNLLKEANGIHRPKEIKEIVGSHSALGAYPVTRAYGAETKVTDILIKKNASNPANADITVQWIGIDNFKYKLLYKESSSDTWLTGQLINAGSSNKVETKVDTIANLPGGKHYNIAVVGGASVGGNNFLELIPQHISSTGASMLKITDNPDSLKSIIVSIPDLG